MRPIIIPQNKLLKAPKPASMMNVTIMPLLQLAIRLRMIHPAKNMLDANFFKEPFKPMLSVAICVSFVGVKLRSMIRDNGKNRVKWLAFIVRFLKNHNGVFSGFIVEFSGGKDFP